MSAAAACCHDGTRDGDADYRERAGMHDLPARTEGDTPGVPAAGVTAEDALKRARGSQHAAPGHPPPTRT